MPGELGVWETAGPCASILSRGGAETVEAREQAAWAAWAGLLGYPSWAPFGVLWQPVPGCLQYL